MKKLNFRAVLQVHNLAPAGSRTHHMLNPFTDSELP
ncbi:hypothetical protein SAMN06265218_10959 [Fodinibius sediminis]|uniref:Uncharacterized protein n=1 Tax=Fodinibius sediminis TaxID=1214077 RepID=A0A521DA22_9BACT|nr:hypothetical protein SAMN06265218_10959 [Fodinibius sediminis]